MKDRVLLIGGGILFLLVVVWLVRSEGQRFRDEMKESTDQAIKEGAGEAAKVVVEKAGEEAGSVIDKAAEAAGTLIDKAAEVPGKVIGDIRDELGGEDEEQQPTPPAKPSAENRAQPPQPAPGVQGGKPTTPEKTAAAGGTAPQPAAPAAGQSGPAGQAEDTAARQAEPADEDKEEKKEKASLTPGDLFGTIVRTGQEISEAVDEVGQEVLGFSDEEECELGEEVHKQVRKHCKLGSPTDAKRLARLAAPLLELRKRKSIPYRFFVVEDEEVNAFSHVGGYIYFNRGLLDLCQTDAELQFVLGHEIAHVDLKHCADIVTYAVRAGELAGCLGAAAVQVAYQAIALGYSENKEFAADKWAYRKLRTIGRSHDEALASHKRLLEHERQNSDPEADTDAEDNVVVREIQNHFRSHPPIPERIERLEKLAP